MTDEMMTLDLDENAIDQVSGGVLPLVWAAGFGLAAVFGGGATFGYQVGKDRAERNNR